MRIVSNLNEVYFCPNCDSPELYVVKDVKSMKEHKYCPRCHEEIRESDIAINNSSPDAISIPYDESRTIKMPEIITHGQEAATRLREEIGYLRSNIHDTHSMMLVNRLTDIFNLIADYMEEH